MKFRKNSSSSIAMIVEAVMLRYVNAGRNKMVTKQKVMIGLAEGKSYKRENYLGCEYVRPTAPGFFEHTVDNGSSGGVAELPIHAMHGYLWATHGWVEC